MEDASNPPEGRLLKVYPPKDAEDETSVDIVAIHGLGTTTPRTWEYKTKTGVINWLSDSTMLPNVVPSARIYAFSWNAKYYEDASVARIDNVADVLLNNLQSQRDNENTHSRPLIFVASCFGGLVVTKALEIANIHDSQFRGLLVATSGVVFLGSPLQGTKAGKAAQWQAMLASMLNKKPSQTLLKDLDGSTRALRETSEKFVRMVSTPPMRTMTMCFWESEPTQVLRAILPAWTLSPFGSLRMIVVEEDSACLFGRPKQILDAPHSMMNKFFGSNDANFGLVSTAIKKMVEKAHEIAHSQREAYRLHNEHFMVSRRPNPLFTGREVELKKLNQALCPSLLTSEPTVGPRIYVIHGMGGSGKSEIAIKFAHDNRSKFWGIFWIDGRSKSSIANSFAAIARQCGHQDESHEETIMWLQNAPHSWLLILDNADNQDLDLAQYLPAGRNGSILITTRLIESAKYETVGKDPYERLNQETSIDLLLKACGIEVISRSDHAERARAVVELLGFHALAIVQAGAAISQSLCTLEDYKDNFMVQRQTLLEYFPGQARSEYGGVYATFEVSAKCLEDRNDQTAKDALQLLSFYAFMHFSDFPEIAFEEAWKNSSDEDVVSSYVNADGEEVINNLALWHVSHLPSFMQSNTHDTNFNRLRLRKARSLLTSLSLVTFDPARGMTRMHPVSHFWSRDRLQDPEKSTKARLNGFCVISLSIKNPYLLDLMPLTRQLQSHIEFLARSLKDWSPPAWKFELQQSIYRLSYVMLRLSCSLALFELLQVIPIKADEYWLRTENGDSIQLLHARCAHMYGDANKAVDLLEKLNDARLQILPEESTKVLDSQHELAHAYLEIEDRTKAIDLLERVVHSRKKKFNPEDENLLASQHELARAYLGIEETTKAIALLEEVVQIEAKTLRPEHSSYLASQHVLAKAYLKIRETQKAIALLESVVEIQAKTLPPEHHDRLISEHELGKAYLEIGEMDKAISLLESVVEIKTRQLGPKHHSRLTSQHELARAYLEIRETDKAISLLEDVVEIRTRIFTACHPDLVQSMYVLAQCHCRARNYQRALELARSIEDVAQDRQWKEIADWNAELIFVILEKMGVEEVTDWRDLIIQARASSEDS